MIFPLVIASALSFAATGEFADLFEAHEYHHTSGHYKEEHLRYRLFVPRDVNPLRRYPLLVWLHGRGPSGTDNKAQLGVLDLILDDPTHIDKYRYFILATQCPSEERGWYRRPDIVDAKANKTDEMLDITVEILQKTMREQPIDPDRVYLTGACSGGAACWEMAMRYPEIYAAVVPMATVGNFDYSRVGKLVSMPIWAFHSLHDDMASPTRAQKRVKSVEKAGGNVHLTFVPTGNHNAWNSAIKEHRCVDWMLAQNRAARICWTPPGVYPWKWRHLLTVPLLFIATVRLGWFLERRRRRRMNRQFQP